MKKIQKSLKEKKSILWIIIFTLLLLFIGAPLFNAIATNKWSLHFINENNYDAWIGYYGSVLGGALTLGGVWWTIKEQDNQRKEDKRIEYKPIIQIKNHYKDAIINNNILTVYYEITNIGRGEAKYIDFNLQPYFFKENNIDKYPLKLLQYQITNLDILNINETKNIRVNIDVSPIDFENYNKLINLQIKLSYKDLYEDIIYYTNNIFKNNETKVLEIKETKTPASCAIVPLPSLLVPILKAWFAENESNLVAPDNDMNLLDPQTVKTFLERYSKRTGVHISSHMFRHTFATRLWENKVDVKIAQRLLRHESYQTTLDVYTSLENENLNNVVNNVYS